MSTATEPRRMTIAEHVGEALVAAREHAGLSRNELARRMGVADTTLLELERGTANPTLGRLERVFDGYGVELVVHVVDPSTCADIYPGAARP